MSDGVSPSRNPLPPPIAPRPRPLNAPVRLFDPDGREHTVPRSNVRDLVKFHGWSETASVDIPPAPGPEEITGESIEPADFADQPDTPRQRLEALDGLRDQLRALGVDPDPKWGVASLESEIARLKENTHDQA